ncbi:ATP-binding protein [Desulfotignum balticum]|jgi:two-component system sensor histidine kinase HydH|uniref:ATP-binding protein n=1 Tax=Desulfotignum balticum TaxID=115781 RepID=UPI0004191307|nr:ATP-binding protein [Desulfotignum balticum]
MKKLSTRSLSSLISPLMLAGVILVLTPIFAVMTLDRMQKLKSHITDQQLAKGISMIRTFEAGTRTGMMTMHWGIRRIQDLLQETAFQPEVVHIMIVSAEGTILAHSDPDRVGQVLADIPDMPDSQATESPVFYRSLLKGEEKVFEVYKPFTPMKSRFVRHPMRMMHGMQQTRGVGSFPDKESSMEKNDVLEKGAWILVGLSMDQMDRAQARLLRDAVGQGVMFFILGCAGVISLMAFQAYRTTKARLVSARALSEKLKKEVETTRHLAAIGKLAGGVAHEIRNPLSSIKGFATYFEQRYADHPDDQDTARIMVQEVERINRSVTQLLEFAKPMAVEKKQVGIREVISHSLKLMAHDLEKKSIAVHTDIRSARSTFYTDPDRMNQILLNLYMNSLTAMDDGGTLTVTVVDVSLNRDLEIRVTDDGCGMDEQILSDIFDPYFTTRPDGTGLGLSIVHRLVETLGGEIRVESVKDQGTTFFIRLSAQEKENSK